VRYVLAQGLRVFSGPFGQVVLDPCVHLQPLSFNRNSYDNRDEVTLRIQSCRNEEKSGDAEESTVWLDAGGHVGAECNLRVSDH